MVDLHQHPAQQVFQLPLMGVGAKQKQTTRPPKVHRQVATTFARSLRSLAVCVCFCVCACHWYERTGRFRETVL